MHAGIDHKDLGHRHGAKPRRGNTDTHSAAETMNELA
jgi:hypothetical protein